MNLNLNLYTKKKTTQKIKMQQTVYTPYNDTGLQFNNKRAFRVLFLRRKRLLKKYKIIMPRIFWLFGVKWNCRA